MKSPNDLVKAIVEWDVKGWKKAIDQWDEVVPQSDGTLSALEIGARRGGLSLYLARKGYQVVCSDVENPESLAKLLHVEFGVEGLITYAAADASQLPFGDNSFDVIAFKSILGSVGQHGRVDLQERTIHECWRVLKPGGMLLFAENLSATRLHMFLRRHFVGWGSRWQYVNISQLEGFLTDFESYYYETFGFIATFGRNEFQRNILFYFDSLLNRFLPDGWKYIVYGYARKS